MIEIIRVAGADFMEKETIGTVNVAVNIKANMTGQERYLAKNCTNHSRLQRKNIISIKPKLFPNTVLFFVLSSITPCKPLRHKGELVAETNWCLQIISNTLH